MNRNVRMTMVQKEQGQQGPHFVRLYMQGHKVGWLYLEVCSRFVDSRFVDSQFVDSQFVDSIKIVPAHIGRTAPNAACRKDRCIKRIKEMFVAGSLTLDEYH